MRTSFRLPLVILLLASTLVARAHETATEMVAAANQFLGSLSADLKKQATYSLTDKERENWNFVPIARQGVPLKQMSAAQKNRALDLVKTGLGQKGLMKAEAIMSLENILKVAEKDTKGRRDPEQYFVTVFGQPSANQSWGWRFEGHHLSFNFTVVDGKHVFFAPSFLGSNPAEVRDGPKKGLRVLADEEDLGLAFVNSLDAAQQKKAIFAEQALKEIETRNEKRVTPLSPTGIAAADLKPAQKEKLNALVKVYLARCRPALADEYFEKIKAAGLDRMTFAWAGGLDRSKQTYYRIQGPTFLIEFDNFQGNGNHIHSTFRDFKGDFGHDLLQEHYKKHHSGGAQK